MQAERQVDDGYAQLVASVERDSRQFRQDVVEQEVRSFAAALQRALPVKLLAGFFPRAMPAALRSCSPLYTANYTANLPCHISLRAARDAHG